MAKLIERAEAFSLRSKAGTKRGGLDGPLGTLGNFVTGSALDRPIMSGGVLGPVEPLEPRGVEGDTAKCRTNSEDKKKPSNST